MELIKQKITAHLRNTVEASAKQISKATDHSEPEVINTLNSMRVYGEIECRQGGRGKGLMYWLATAEKSPSAVASDEVAELRQKLEQVTAERDTAWGELLQIRVAIKANSEESTVDEVAALLKKHGDLELAVDAAQQTIASMELEAEQATASEEPVVDVKDAAVGYLIRVAGRKPRVCIKPERARDAALASARAHGRADVLALVPVGSAVRGAEWKERKVA